MKTVLKNVLLLTSSILFVVITCEIFLRVGGYRVVTFYPLSGFYQFDSDLGWIQVPNYEAEFQGREFKVTMKSNSQGFRDQEYSFSKEDGSKRFIVLGDSFTWGWGVEREEIFCEVTEQILEGIDFINLGQGAYSTAQEYLIYQKLGRNFSPDLTILAFGPNDIMENSGRNPKRPRFTVQDDALYLASSPVPFSFSETMKKTLKDHFLLYSLIDYRIALLKPIKNKPNGYDWVPNYYLKTYQDTMAGPWEVTQKLLLEINRLAKQRLLILYIPNRLQVEVETYRQAVLTTKIDENLIDLSYPNKLVKEFAEREGIPFLDFTPYFKKTNQKKPLYFRYDGHWTKEGHRLAGQLLSEKLKKYL